MEAIYGRLRVNVNLPPSSTSWSMPRYHWKLQCTAVLNLDPSALSCVTKLGWKLSNGGQVLNTPIRRAFGVLLLYRAYIILFYSSNIGIFFLEFNLKDYIEVQETKKKYVVLCSRPPKTAKQSVFLRIQVWASSQTKGRERGWKQRARLGKGFLSPHTPYGRVRLECFVRVRLLHHALPISDFEKKPTVLQSNLVYCLLIIHFIFQFLTTPKSNIFPFSPNFKHLPPS